MSPSVHPLSELEALLPQTLVRDRLWILKRVLGPDGKVRHLNRADWNVLLDKAHASRTRWRVRAERLPRVQFPEELPISSRAEEIIRTIRENPVVIVAGETGSGKSTQLPKLCLAAGLGAGGRIGCTQPRRVAALSVSRRVAEELGVEWGREVGCQIRFQDNTAQETVIKFMTDGVLLAEVQGDPELSDYEAIIIDEAHERSLNIDFLLGYLIELRSKRPDLKVIITSATLDTETFAKAFNAPVISVEGRMFPVEVRYRPLDHDAEESGEMTYIECAAATIEEILIESNHGGILVFLPGERDIHELRDVLQGRAYGPLEVLPLFGRLSAAEQQRIFSPSSRRKVVLATNIAETSLTIPGIRYVVDTGLARISRYSAQTRTLRLPVEPVSISAADQRKGRCGRVAEGICYRLYSEADLLARPRFTQPEIQRANLAAVLLRMLAFKLGKIETFPFLNPPADKAIRGAYALLRELGALEDEETVLSTCGQQLARLPVDPTVGRMLLQARREGSLREVMVIAAALSIQDPRERPVDKRDAADLMHRRFNHAESDFLTLLAIWNALHDECERMSQRLMRKFCNEHFLNFQRMREWRDIHEQLGSALDDLDELQLNAKPAEYHQIHRALVAGLLTNIAQRDQGNIYRATHQRQVMIFPGSSLFDKKAADASKAKPKGADTDKTKAKPKNPEWIVAGEWMETSRLYARTVARIDPEWIAELGVHLTRSSFSEPGWDKAAGRVLCKERILLQGLIILLKKADYGRIKPAEATEIFIRSALIEGEVREKIPFLEHNQRLREKVEDWLTRLRRVSAWGVDERLYQFYSKHLHTKKGDGISSIHDLNRCIREEHDGRDDFLRCPERELIGDENLAGDAEAFPDTVELNGAELSVSYAYKPGSEEDGATLQIPVGQLDSVQGGALDWIVPGFVEERVQALLKSLPKEQRVKLHPLADTTKKLLTLLTPGPEPLQDSLARLIKEHFGIHIWPTDWRLETIAEHLRPRIQIVDKNHRVLAAGRDWGVVGSAFKAKVETTLKQGEGIESTQLWQQALKRHEKLALTAWTFGDLPESLLLGEFGGVPIRAWPGLVIEAGSVSLRLYKSARAAAATSTEGYMKLAEMELGRDLAWLREDLAKEISKHKDLLWHFTKISDLRDQATRLILRHLFPLPSPLILTETSFRKQLESARVSIRKITQPWGERFALSMKLRRDVLLGGSGYPGMQEDAQALMPPNLLEVCSHAQLEHLPRYLRGMLKRAERYKHNPLKDAEKFAKLAPYLKQFNDLATKSKSRADIATLCDELRWFIEEYKISLFAQDLGTAIPVSEKRLQERLAGIVALLSEK
ncbi:MAG: ATP-dependent RNA helicase HrpA [Verrucomicrobiota bacterium]|nr:ATP-dependent RNA helicase HrpA [Verrucomicrobiota bacterium]